MTKAEERALRIKEANELIVSLDKLRHDVFTGSFDTKGVRSRLSNARMELQSFISRLELFDLED